MAIQIQEFAERVLFGTTLEEKLSFPKELIIDTRPGSAIQTPRILPRPPCLQVKDQGVKSKHPATAKLVDETERGRLLHFFGNHELLATELMALVLLKFPDAPKSFRRGILETLKEEQIHTQLYIHRMKQCGIQFGELPLSDYFWKSVSSMHDPLDYVTRLSLTFEQANLDYSKEYSRIFNEIGDTATAKVLEKIYQDEIEHVGFGLRWFRKWKANGQSDWEAFSDRLHFPLSPMRAKGREFNKKGRKLAGLNDQFISELELFSRSKGRTPSIYWFNPDAERFACLNHNEVLRSTNTLSQNLEFLLAFLARKDDILLVSKRPSAQHIKKLQKAGFTTPEILKFESTPSTQRAPEISRKIGSLRPWAWTPDSLRFFKPLWNQITHTVTPEDCWNVDRRTLFSKTWSLMLAKSLQKSTALDSILAPQNLYGRTIKNISELKTVREDFRTEGQIDVVCKAPFGTAANGQRCLIADEEIPEDLIRWAKTVIKEQGSLIIEPWLNRVFDFSIQLKMQEGSLKNLGYTRMRNNLRGQFKGIITHGFVKGLTPDLKRFVMEKIDDRPRLYQLYEDLILPTLEKALKLAHYEGPLGIDAFIYKDSTGHLRIKPIVEVNTRYTMGRIALELEAQTSPSSSGYFEIINKSTLRSRTSKSFADYIEEVEKNNPVIRLSRNPNKILSGSIGLTPTSTSPLHFVALYHVKKAFKELPI